MNSHPFFFFILLACSFRLACKLTSQMQEVQRPLNTKPELRKKWAGPAMKTLKGSVRAAGQANTTRETALFKKSM